MSLSIKWSSQSLPHGDPVLDAEVAVAFQGMTSANVTTCPAYYLHGVRSGILNMLGSEAAAWREQTYRAIEPKLAALFCEALQQRGVAGASLVVPPSSRTDARPFADALLQTGIAARDFSRCLARRDPTFRAGATSTWPAVRASIEVVPGCLPLTHGPLIVVDDVLSSGRSSAASVCALADAGLISPGTKVIVLAVMSMAIPTTNP